MPNADNQTTWRTASLIAACHRTSAPMDKINEVLLQGGRLPTTYQEKVTTHLAKKTSFPIAWQWVQMGADADQPSLHWVLSAPPYL